MDTASPDERNAQLVNGPPPTGNMQPHQPTGSSSSSTNQPTGARPTHLEAITAKKPYACEVSGCQKRFGSFLGVRSHFLGSHRKGLKCRYEGCDFSFPLYSKRDQHEISFHRRYMFSCIMCEYSILKEREIREHIINHHKNIGMNEALIGIINGVDLGGTKVEAKPTGLICYICGQSTRSESGMKMHVARIHRDVDVKMAMARIVGGTIVNEVHGSSSKDQGLSEEAPDDTGMGDTSV